jgi:hypothetical protein
VSVLPLRDGGDRVLLAAWIEPGAGYTLGYAFVGATGAMLEGPVDAVADDPARLGGLYLVPVRDERLTARAVVRADDGTSLDVREVRIKFGEAPVLPDGGTDAGTDAGAAADSGHGRGHGRRCPPRPAAAANRGPASSLPREGRARPRREGQV